MIPLSVIHNLEHVPYQFLIPALKKFSDEDLESTRQELLQFRDQKRNLTYKNVFAAIEDIQENRSLEVINLE